jgi:hypothetical protein
MPRFYFSLLPEAQLRATALRLKNNAKDMHDSVQLAILYAICKIDRPQRGDRSAREFISCLNALVRRRATSISHIGWRPVKFASHCWGNLPPTCSTGNCGCQRPSLLPALFRWSLLPCLRLLLSARQPPLPPVPAKSFPSSTVKTLRTGTRSSALFKCALSTGTFINSGQSLLKEVMCWGSDCFFWFWVWDWSVGFFGGII